MKQLALQFLFVVVGLAGLEESSFAFSTEDIGETVADVAGLSYLGNEIIAVEEHAAAELDVTMWRAAQRLRGVIDALDLVLRSRTAQFSNSAERTLLKAELALQRAVADVRKGIYLPARELEDTIMLDLMTVIDGLPFKSKRQLVRRISSLEVYGDGRDETIRVTGLFEEPVFRLAGRELSGVRHEPPYSYLIPLPEDVLMMHERQFDPVFLELEIQSRRSATYETSILIRPRFPVRWVDASIQQEVEYLGEPFTVVGESTLPRSVKSGRYVAGTVRAACPPGSVLTSHGQAKATHAPHDWVGYDGVQVSDNAAIAFVRNQIHDASRHFVFPISCQKKLKKTEPARFPGLVPSKNKGIPEGTYRLRLPASAVTWDLTLVTWTGQKIALHPLSPKGGGASTTTETLGSSGEKMLRLKVEH